MNCCGCWNCFWSACSFCCCCCCCLHSSCCCCCCLSLISSRTISVSLPCLVPQHHRTVFCASCLMQTKMMMKKMMTLRLFPSVRLHRKSRHVREALSMSMRPFKTHREQQCQLETETDLELASA